MGTSLLCLRIRKIQTMTEKIELKNNCFQIKKGKGKQSSVNLKEKMINHLPTILTFIC
jgi:hypothetical protein